MTTLLDEEDVSQPFNVYDPLEWMDEADFAKHIAAGRPGSECGSEIKRELLRMIFGSPIFAIRNYLFTTDKYGDLVRIDPWIGQTLHDYTIECQRRRGLPQRIVEIKARQVGFTAHNLARGFAASLRPRTKVLVLVNSEPVAASLMLRVGEMYNGLPRWLRPMKRIENVKELVLDNPNTRTRDTKPGLNSRYTIGVPSSFRGDTPHFFIWSEAAHCDVWEDVDKGVIQGMAANSRSCIILDTTPNSYDDFYWPLVEASVQRNPTWVSQWDGPPPTRDEIIAGKLGEPDVMMDWVVDFCPWRWHEQFTTQDEDPKWGELPCLTDKELQHLKATVGKKDEYGGEEELELMQRHGTSLFRLAWRRYKINMAQGADPYMKLLKFRQEFPTTWRSGFVTFGHGAFDARGLDKLATWLGPGSKYGPRPPLAHGCLRRDNDGDIYIDQTFISDWMTVDVWALPDPYEDYVLTVDTAQTYGHKDCDRTVATVLRRRDRKFVATMKCRAAPDDYREQVYLLYHWYNRAYLGIEMETDGYDLAWTLWNRGCTNQYFYRRPDVPTYKPPMEALGWETNKKSRWSLQNCWISAIALKNADGQPEPDIIVPDQEMIDELLAVKRDVEGFIENKSGGHDDLFMAGGIALALDEDPWLPYSPRQARETRPKMNPLIEALGFPDVLRYARNQPSYERL